MNKSELLVDYCQRCGEEIGSFKCCQSETNKWLRELSEEIDRDAELDQASIEE